ELAVGGGTHLQAHTRTPVRAPRTTRTAAAARSVICAKSWAASRSADTSQDPPTARTDGSARYAARPSAVMPPVGTNRTPLNGAANALSAARPPEASAGKNLTASRPASRAAWISVAVATPGSTGTPERWHSLTTAAEKPGDTM